MLLLLPILLAGSAYADPVFDRAASLSPPPAGARSVGQGTGFFISGDGILLTAAHLVASCRRIDVPGHPGAILLQADRDADVAVLRVAAQTQALRLAQRGMRADGPVAILGYPDDLDASHPARLTGRTLNRQARAFDPGNPPAGRELILQAPIRHGDSGGPVLDRAGAVIGLIQGILPDAADVQASYGLALPDIAVGPGVDPIRHLIGERRLRPGTGTEPAVVRVLCWN